MLLFSYYRPIPYSHLIITLSKMKISRYTLSTCTAASLLILLFSFAVSPAYAQFDDMSADEFTSSSEEAKELMLQAYRAWEEIRMVDVNMRIKEALEKDPEFPIANAVYATILMQSDEAAAKKHMDKAMASLDQVTESEQLSIKDIANTVNKNPDPQYLLTLTEMQPQRKGHKMSLSYFYAFGPQKDLDKALEHANALIDMDPKYMPAYNAVGYIHMEKGEMEQAKAAFEKAMELRPDLANPHDSMGDYFVAAGMHDKAAEHFAMAYEIDPVNAEASKAKMEKAKAEAGL